MRIGFIKPDHGFRGGFEILIEQLVNGLRGRGHRAETVRVDASTEASCAYGVPIPDAFRYWHNEYMDYISLTERVSRLVLDDFDLMVATQPPTWHAEHDNMIGLFFHQGRVFYDLYDEFVAGGFASPDTHELASQAVRRIDEPAVARVRTWLAGSTASASRLRDYWGVAPRLILPYRHPAVTHGVPDHDPSLVEPGVVASVGRLEWPKRVELAVAAAHRSTRVSLLEVIGGGSRTDFVRDIDSRLGNGSDLDDYDLWRNRGPVIEGWEPSGLPPSGRVHLAGRVSDAERDRLVSRAAALVAPALAEDYGLTALEAFAAAKPLIVCSDGGGLTELVVDGETGLVSEPSPEALAEAMDRLIGDPALASRLGQAGRELGAGFTLDRALDQFEAAL